MFALMPFFHILLTTSFVLEAAFFLWLGIRGIVTKRPFILPTRWFLVVITLTMLPAFLSIHQSGREIHHYSRSGGPDALLNVMPLFLLLVVFMLWINMRGYIVYGVTEESFRGAVRAALERMNLPYEESMSGMYLPTLDAKLNAAVQGRMGSAQLQVKQKQHAYILKPLAAGMTEYFAGGSVPVNMTSCAFNVASGGLMLVMAVAIFSMFSWVDHLNSHLPPMPPMPYPRTITAAERSPWRIPGPAPARRSSAAVQPNLVGTWVGKFGSDNDSALLAVSKQKDGSFEGVLVSRDPFGTSQIRMHGTLLPDGRLTMEEAKVLKGPSRAGWALGMDAGMLSKDGLTLVGSGADTNSTTYLWHFRHQSTRVVIPSN